MKGKATKKCIVCLKKATIFGGHVIDENGKCIIAGFCQEHSEVECPHLLNREGCYGAWHKRYGLIDEF